MYQAVMRGTEHRVDGFIHTGNIEKHNLFCFNGMGISYLCVKGDLCCLIKNTEPMCCSLKNPSTYEYDS